MAESFGFEFDTWLGAGILDVTRRKPTCVNFRPYTVADMEAGLVSEIRRSAVADFLAAAKLFGQPQYAGAFCEPIRHCPYHADLEHHAEPKSGF